VLNAWYLKLYRWTIKKPHRFALKEGLSHRCELLTWTNTHWTLEILNLQKPLQNNPSFRWKKRTGWPPPPFILVFCLWHKLITAVSHLPVAFNVSYFLCGFAQILQEDPKHQFILFYWDPINDFFYFQHETGFHKSTNQCVKIVLLFHLPF